MSFLSRSITQIKSRWHSHRAPAIPNPIPKDGATLVVTHAELTARHGTGALLLKILRNEPDLVVFYARDFFKMHDVDVPAFHITHSGKSAGGSSESVRKLLAGKPLRRILCVPFYEDDALTALAAKQATGAPLVLYVMDDQNIHVQEISDDSFGSLVSQADLCLAISPLLCAAYQAKYGRRFWLAPPVADPNLFVPEQYHFEPNLPPRGVLVGNLWSSHTLGRFRETIRLSGLQIDWYGNAGKPFIALDPDELRKEGIALHPHIPERTLADIARTADFAVVPAGTLDGTDTHEWLARASIPSRIIFLIAAANVPIVVLGHPETAAAQFVIDLGLGGVCDYAPESFAATVSQLTEPAASMQIRERSRKLSPLFSSTEFSEWLWKSLAQGSAVDNRFQSLMLNFDQQITNPPPVLSVARPAKRHQSNDTSISMLTKFKNGISSVGQRALGIDDVRFKLGVALEKLDSGLAKLDLGLAKLDSGLGKLEKLDLELTKLDRLAWIEGDVGTLNQQVQNLRSYLAWSTHRVEPWFWTGNFSQSDPEEELAALLFNFLVSRILVDAGPGPGRFAQVAAEIGYQVFCLEPPNTIDSLVASGTLPGPIDFLNLAKDVFDLQFVNTLDSLQPTVIQAEFFNQELPLSHEGGQQSAHSPLSEIMKEMRKRQYYWTVIIFRTEAEDFIRLATNLVILPNQAWGKILFFRDYQLFLKAFHWCKTALPRFRAAPLAK
jgi:hypothetical protein